MCRSDGHWEGRSTQWVSTRKAASGFSGVRSAKRRQDNYENYIRNHIESGLGNIKLKSLTPIQIQQFYNFTKENRRVAKAARRTAREPKRYALALVCLHLWAMYVFAEFTSKYSKTRTF